MHAYYRHIGDYNKRASHLSALEHGILLLLEDHYLSNEKPIPDWNAHRIARAPRADVEPVLREFFYMGEDDESWYSPHCIEVMESYRKRGESSRENGKLGGRPRKVRPEGDQPAPPAGGKETPPAKPKKTRKVPPGSTIVTDEYPAGFRRFWDAYPDGKRSKKADAFKVWERDGMEEFADVLVADVEKRKAMHWGWMKDNGQYIPGAQVYLNGQRWKDDIEPPPMQRGGGNGQRGGRENTNLQTARDWARGQPPAGGNVIDGSATKEPRR